MCTYRPPAGKAATDSRRLRPNTENGTFDMVTTEWRRPDGCGACDNVAKNSASFLSSINIFSECIKSISRKLNSENEII